MKTYEIMFIVRPTLGEDDVKKVVSTFEKILTDKGATVKEIQAMGQRELAYEIKDFKSGYYYLVTLTSQNDEAIREFDRVGKNSKDIIRHLITKLED